VVPVGPIRGFKGRDNFQGFLRIRASLACVPPPSPPSGRPPPPDTGCLGAHARGARGLIARIQKEDESPWRLPSGWARGRRRACSRC